VALYGLLLNAPLALAGGLAALVLINLACAPLAALGHLRRARLVRAGAYAEGAVTRKRRRALLHELLRAPAHRTFELRYSYTPAGEGAPREGRLLLCRCAYERLDDGEPLYVSYDPAAPHRSVPLRVAVMRIPH